MSKISRLPKSYRNSPSQLAKDTMFKKLWSIAGRISFALNDQDKPRFEDAVGDLTAFYVNQSKQMREFLNTPSEAAVPWGEGVTAGAIEEVSNVL